MCERNDTPAGEIAGNLVYSRFKKQLTESGFKTICRKCNTKEGYVLLQKKDVFCGDCLVEYCVHKFRATMGKSKLLKPGEAVLVGVSGGNASIALVDMIKKGLAEDNIHRRLRFEPALVHIDESLLNPDESRGGLRRDLFDYLINSGLDCYFTTIEASTSPTPLYISLHSASNDQTESIDAKYEKVQSFMEQSHTQHGPAFLEAFSKLKTLSLKQDFISRLRPLLLVSTTKAAGIRRVFVASTASELSISLMSHISTGRGVELQSEMNFCDSRYPEVSLIRPIREFTQKELAFYCRYRNLASLICKTSKSTNATSVPPLKASIHRLTEHFLNTLAEEFPSTIYTVFKTGNKITGSKGHSGGDEEKPLERCRFCYAKVDITFQRDGGSDYTAFDALQLTAALSIGEDVSKKDSPVTGELAKAQLCYSCLRLESEMNSNGDENVFERFCKL